MRRLLLAVLGLALSAGCNGQMTEGLQPLPEDEARKHEAPRADGRCRALRERPESWVSAVEFGALEKRETFRLEIDPCGNTLLAATSQIGNVERLHSPRVTRLFSDGELDWNASPTWGETVWSFDMAVDQYGNVVVLTESSLFVVTASGELHDGIPKAGLPLNGHLIRQTPGGWAINGSKLVQLPSGTLLAGADTPWGRSGDDRWDQVILLGGESEIAIINQPFDGRSYTGSELLVSSSAEGHLIFIHAPEDPSFYAETALLAADSERTFLGSTYYVADPATLERIECSESVLIDIRDEAWKPDPLGFCGAIEAMALVDGSLFSLWSVPVEPLDPEYHPFEAVPILMRHDLDGRETGRFDLESIIGRTHQDGTGALDMAITDDGKAAIVGILSGGPWSGRFYLSPSTATVARVSLD